MSPDSYGRPPMSFMLFTNISRRTANGAPPMLKKIGSFGRLNAFFGVSGCGMLRKTSSISQRFGSFRSSQNVYSKQKKGIYGIQAPKGDTPDWWLLVFNNSPQQRKYYYHHYYIQHIYIYACVCVYIYSCHELIFSWFLSFLLEKMLRTVPCLQVFEGSRVPRLVDFQTLVGQSLKSPLVRNATSRKAGKLHCSLQPIPKSTYINLTWSGLSSQIWLKTMKHPSSLSQAMSLNYIVLHQHI